MREDLDALRREVTYSDIPPANWKRELKRVGIAGAPDPASNDEGQVEPRGRYDQMSDSVERVTGRLAMSVREFMSLHADKFGGRRS